MKFYLASALVFLEAALVSTSGCSSLEHFWVGKTMMHRRFRRIDYEISFK